jgi:hypothetical protein
MDDGRCQPRRHVQRSASVHAAVFRRAVIKGFPHRWQSRARPPRQRRGRIFMHRQRPPELPLLPPSGRRCACMHPLHGEAMVRRWAQSRRCQYKPGGGAARILGAGGDGLC